MSQKMFIGKGGVSMFHYRQARADELNKVTNLFHESFN